MSFDMEEKKLIESIEKGEWRSIENLDQEINRARQSAEETFRKDQRMNIRISKRDLNNLKIKALEEGVPYQTLVSSLIHKYLAGRLHEV
jgi:predicted DNA binding CopG/RHH family protein